jgi:large subunit ribosomal protein L4
MPESTAITAPVLGGGTVELDQAAFGAAFNMALVHETVRAEQASRRQGTSSTKTRGKVRGGGAKPWRQKGTGRARAGSSRSPIWTGGGTVFGPSPRHYTFKINRKARRAALRSSLSLHAERGSLAVFDATQFAAPSSKDASALLRDWAVDGKILVVLAQAEEVAYLSFRNLTGVHVLEAKEAAVVDLIGAANVLVSESALPLLAARATGVSEIADDEDTSAHPQTTSEEVEA